MKKYITIAFATAILFSCNNGNIDAVNTNANTSDSATQIVVKNNAAPAESIFTMDDTFQTQDKKDLVLSSLAGRPTVICMIFTNCGYACPKLTGEMKTIADKLNTERDKVNFVMVSFDTDRDTPEQLKKFQNQMSLDDKWILLHGGEQTVRTLSVLLNVQFEKDAEGDFSHSNVISVLDKNGALAFQKEGLEADQKETVDKIKELIN
jgi:protein SCO1/2